MWTFSLLPAVFSACLNSIFGPNLSTLDRNHYSDSSHCCLSTGCQIPICPCVYLYDTSLFPFLIKEALRRDQRLVDGLEKKENQCLEEWFWEQCWWKLWEIVERLGNDLAALQSQEDLPLHSCQMTWQKYHMQ